MSDNVSKEGTTADLEWMHRVGIGGTHPMGPVVGRDGKETQGEYDAFYAGVRK